MKRDFRYGVPYYKYIGDSDSTELAAIFNNNKLSSIFSGLYVQTELLNGTGEKVVQYWDVGATPGELRADFQTKYENCQWMVPFYFDSDTGNTAAVARLNSIVNEVINENCYKYRKLAETLGFVYDPLQDFFEEYGGEDEIARIYSDKVNLKEITGPIAGITYDSTTKTYSFNFDEIKRVGKETVGGTTTTKGAQIDGVSSTTTRTPNQGGGYTDQTTNSVSYTNDPDGALQINTSNYKTTMDSDATGRLGSYQTEQGSIASADDYIEKQEVPVMGRVAEGNQSPDYTDTKTLGTTKSGRHVSAADLIEAQRNLARYSLEKEFFDDLKKKLVIAGWD